MVKKSEQICPKPGRQGMPEAIVEAFNDFCTSKTVKSILLFS